MRFPESSEEVDSWRKNTKDVWRRLKDPSRRSNPPENPNTDRGGKEDVSTVGMKAPDFEATAYVDGDFTNIKLSDYAGKWVTLCFYPGDFTFV